MIRKYCSPTPIGRLIKYVLITLSVILFTGMFVAGSVSADDNTPTKNTTLNQDTVYNNDLSFQYTFKFAKNQKLNYGDQFIFKVSNTGGKPGIDTDTNSVDSSIQPLNVSSSGNVFSVATKQSSDGKYTYVILTANRNAPTDYYSSMVEPTVTINMKPSKNSVNTSKASENKDPINYTIQSAFKPANGEEHDYDTQTFKVNNVIDDSHGDYKQFTQMIFKNKAGLPFPDLFKDGTPYADNGYSDVTRINEDCLDPGTNSKNIMYLYSQNAFIGYSEIALPKSYVTGTNAIKQMQDRTNGYKDLTWTVQIVGSKSGQAKFDIQDSSPLGVYRSGSTTPDSNWQLDKTKSTDTKLVYTLNQAGIDSLDPEKDQGIALNVAMPILTKDASDWANVTTSLTGDPASDKAKIPDSIALPDKPYEAHMFFSDPNAAAFQPVLYENENAIGRTAEQLIQMSNQKDGKNYFKDSVANGDNPYPYDATTEPGLTGDGTGLIRFGYWKDDSGQSISNNDTFVRDCYDFNNNANPGNVNRKNITLHYDFDGLFQKVVSSSSSTDANGNPEPELDDDGQIQIATGSDAASFNITKDLAADNLTKGLYVGYIYATNDVTVGGKEYQYRSPNKMVKLYISTDKDATDTLLNFEFVDVENGQVVGTVGKSYSDTGTPGNSATWTASDGTKYELNQDLPKGTSSAFVKQNMPDGYEYLTSGLPNGMKQPIGNDCLFPDTKDSPKTVKIYVHKKGVTPTPVTPVNPTPVTPTPTPNPTPVTPTPEEPSTPSEPIAKKGEAVYSLKKIYLYKNNTFSKNERRAGYSRKPRVYRPMFVVTGYSHSKNGRLRYQVRDVNHLTKNKGKKGYITAQWAYVRPVYYQSSHKTLTVINPRGVNAYTNVNLTGKVRNYKQGTVLHVTKFVKHNLTTT